MEAEVGPFVPVYLPRIAQLTNKTNQFNLTTRRFTEAEIAAFSRDDRYVTLFGRLADKFGDNGLVTVLLGRIAGDCLHMDLWLMSCRVIKRDLERAMFQELKREARLRGIRHIRGYYIPTKKNAMVKDHYPTLGFAFVGSGDDGSTVWSYDIELNLDEGPLRLSVKRYAGPMVEKAPANP
jgi:FkbH-like protein